MKVINNLNDMSEKENKLFNRKEIQINIEAEITPSHKEAKELISKKFSTQPENIRVKKISGKFGTKIFTISANIYTSEEEKNKIEIFSKKEAEKEKKPEPVTPSVPQDTEDKKTEVPAEAPLQKEQEVSNEIAKQEAVEDKTSKKIEKIKQEKSVKKEKNE